MVDILEANESDREREMYTELADTQNKSAAVCVAPVQRAINIHRKRMAGIRTMQKSTSKTNLCIRSIDTAQRIVYVQYTIYGRARHENSHDIKMENTSKYYTPYNSSQTLVFFLLIRVLIYPNDERCHLYNVSLSNQADQMYNKNFITIWRMYGMTAFLSPRTKSDLFKVAEYSCRK